MNVPSGTDNYFGGNNDKQQSGFITTEQLRQVVLELGLPFVDNVQIMGQLRDKIQVSVRQTLAEFDRRLNVTFGSTSRRWTASLYGPISGSQYPKSWLVHPWIMFWATAEQLLPRRLVRQLVQAGRDQTLMSLENCR